MHDNKIANASHAKVYTALSSILDFPNNDQKLWWHSAAPMFAHMLQVTNDDDIHAQYRWLVIFKKCIIPFLGVYPTNDRERWLSVLTRYGTPFELSLNCNDSLVRFTYEPINAATGTTQDPFNTHAIWEALQSLLSMQGDIDLQWFTHFKNDLTVNDKDTAVLLRKNLSGVGLKTQNKLALDLKGNKFVVKTYIYPTLKSVVTGKSIKELVFDSAHRLSKRYPSIAAPLSTLEEYVNSLDARGTTSTRLMSCDLVDPSESRIKIYIHERMVSKETMENLWTLGGRRNDPNAVAGLAMIHELWDLLGMEPGLRSYPEPYLPIGTVPDERLPTMANFTLHHDDPIPDAQVYFTTFGMNDMAIADGLTTFFERRGWTDMAREYKDSLKAYYPYDAHDNMNWLHAYISFSFKKNKPYLSVYLQSFETGDWAVSNFSTEHKAMPSVTDTKASNDIMCKGIFQQPPLVHSLLYG